MRAIKSIFIIGIICFSFYRCEDPELDQLMDRYCDCISATIHKPDKRIDCIMLMDSIKAKYKGRQHKTNKIIEHAGQCHN